MFNEYSDMVTIEELCEMLRIGRNKAYKLLRKQQIKNAAVFMPNCANASYSKKTKSRTAKRYRFLTPSDQIREIYKRKFSELVVLW